MRERSGRREPVARPQPAAADRGPDGALDRVATPAAGLELDMQVERTGPIILHRTGPSGWLAWRLASSHDNQHRSRVDIAKDARDLYRAYLALDRASGDSALDARLADLVKLRASQLNGCAYCVDMHTHDALAAGESQRRLFAVSAWRESPLFSERERAALALTRGAHAAPARQRPRHSVRGRRRALRAQELAALLYAIVTINGWNRLAVATHMTYEP